MFQTVPARGCCVTHLQIRSDVDVVWCGWCTTSEIIIHPGQPHDFKGHSRDTEEPKHGESWLPRDALTTSAEGLLPRIKPLCGVAALLQQSLNACLGPTPEPCAPTDSSEYYPSAKFWALILPKIPRLLPFSSRPLAWGWLNMGYSAIHSSQYPLWASYKFSSSHCQWSHSRVCKA